MINDLVVSNDQFDGDMMKYADDTNVSEYITDQAENNLLQEVTNSIVDWSERNKSSLIHQNVNNLLCLLNGMNQISSPSVLMNHKLNELTNYRFLV
jgi:hypothetical protein